MWITIITILGLASITNLWINSEPTTKLRYWLYNKIWGKCRDWSTTWHWKLINCALCSGFWIGLLVTWDIYLAAIISVCAEFICKKLTGGKLW